MSKANSGTDMIMQKTSIVSYANRLTATVTKAFKIAMVLYCAQPSVMIHPLNPAMRVDNIAASGRVGFEIGRLITRQGDASSSDLV